MKIIFYLFILSQLINLLSVFADKVKKDSPGLDLIKWEKINDEKTNNVKKIIWKSYRDDESYFQEENQDKEEILEVEIKSEKLEKNIDKEEILEVEVKLNKPEDNQEYSIKKENNILENNQIEFPNQNIRRNTQIESYLPLNNFLKKGDFDTTIQWKSAFSGGAGGGIGHQNISVRFDYGLDKNSLLSFYVAESDDPLFNSISNEIFQNSWSVFALGASKKLFESNNLKNSISFSSSLEYWIITSGKDYRIPSKSMFREINAEKGLDRFAEIVGSLSIPYSRKINPKTTFALVPGFIFIPESLGDKTVSDNFYGNSFYLGSGLEYIFSDEISLSGSYTYLFGPGNNYFNESLKFSRKPIYSFGVNWNVNPIIGLEGKVTNGYGATPTTGLLTIPSANEALYYLGVSYKPYLRDTNLLPLKNENKLLKFGGLSVDNSILPRRGQSSMNFDYHSSGNLFGSYSYSLSNILQLNLMSAGSFKTKDTALSKQSILSNTFLHDYNLNYRIGGKLLLFSPEKNDLIWLSSRVSFGRDLHLRQGYIYTDLTSTMKLNNWLTFNINPKYIYSGVGNLGALGLSNNINLSENLQFIAETNIGLTKNSASNSTFSFRYAFSPDNSIDLFTTNSVGFQDIGSMLSTSEYKFGIRLNYIF